ARPALRAFVADHHHITRLYFVAEDAGHRRVLAFVDARAAFEHVDGLVHAGGLHHAAVAGDVAVQHGEAAFPRIRVRDVADAAFGAVAVQRRPARDLAEGDLGRDAGGAGPVERRHGFVVVARDVPARDGLAQARCVHGG